MKITNKIKLLVVSSALLLTGCVSGNSQTSSKEIETTSGQVSQSSKAGQSSKNDSKSSSQAKSSSSKSTSAPHSHSYNKTSRSDHDLYQCSCGDSYLAKGFTSTVESSSTYLDSGNKLKKGVTLTWKFTIPEESLKVAVCFSAKMSSDSHSSRSLFTNPDGADSSDSFESNEANRGTPRFVLKSNGTECTLNTQTYGEMGLSTSSSYFTMSSEANLKKGENTITLTTHAQTGYRLLFDGDIRLTYKGTGGSGTTSSTGNTSSSTPAPTTSVDPSQAGFQITTNLTETKEIHTANQAKYLQYSKSYYNITANELTSFGANGTSENSFPNAVPLAWNYTNANGKTVSYYSVKFGQKEDLSDGIEIKGTSSKSLNLYNSYLGKNYFQVIAYLSDGSNDASAIYSYNVNTQAPRNLKIGNLSNCRDIGGRTTSAGGKIKQGMLFRTAEPSSSDSGCKKTFVDELKVKTEIYVKDGGSSDGTSSVLGSSVKYYNCSMDYGTKAYSNLSRNAERLRRVFSILSEEKNYPVFYHCRIGTDRTGLVGMLSNGVLGIPFEEVLQDYGFSNFGKIDGQRYAHKANDTNGDDPAKYIDEILKLPGANFQEQCYNALRSMNVPEAQLNSFIDIMTEGNKANLNNSQIFGDGSKLTTTGGTKKTATDYKSPEVYYQIGNGQNVSFTTTTEAKQYAVVIYLANASNSTSKKLSDTLTLKIDGTDKTVPSTTYQLAGFGTPSTGRYAYMFNIFAKENLSAGSHTVTIGLKSSDTFYIGGIHLIPTTNA